jgi:class 3 adenylate cyclase
MQSNWRNYTSDDSNDRLTEILDAPAGNFEEVESIPDRQRLTYSNGFYVNCTAVFIDIRGSSSLPNSHTKPVLGKIYRAYISECVALLNTYRSCAEIYIAGDCVSAIFNTPNKANIDEAFFAAASLNSLIIHLNWRLERKDYVPIRCGIGISYGRALMLKSGFRGSGINDVIWMGDVVNEASNLCHQGNKGIRLPIQVSTSVHDAVNQGHRNLLAPVFGTSIFSTINYEGAFINPGMENWLIAKKERVAQTSLAAGLGILGLNGSMPVKPPSSYFGLGAIPLMGNTPGLSTNSLGSIFEYGSSQTTNTLAGLLNISKSQKN